MVKHPAAISNHRVKALGSVIAEVLATIPVLVAVVLVFLAAVLLDFAAIFLLLVFLTAVFFTTELAFFVTTEPVAAGTVSFSCKILADPGVGISVQLHTPLISAQAWPVLAAG